MHTLLFSKHILPDVYYNILNSIPHTVVEYSSKFKKYKITVEQLQIAEEDRDNMRAVQIYLMSGKWGKEPYIDYFMAEVNVNCSMFFDSDSNTSPYGTVEAGSIFMMALESVIITVCRVIPQLDNLERDVPYKGLNLQIWDLLGKQYSAIHPEVPQSDVAKFLFGASASERLQILAELAQSNSQSVQEMLQTLFENPQIITQDSERNRLLFNCIYPPEFMLKRIDYTFDMYTDYKQIYLELVSRGYGMIRKVNKVYRSGAGDEVESIYIRLKSYRINIYDKLKELNDKNRTVADDGKVGKLLRFEVQAESGKINNELKKRERDCLGRIDRSAKIDRSGKMLSGMSDFISYEMEHEMLEYYFKKIIGTGNYYTITAAKEIVNASGHKESMKEKLNKVLGHVARRGSIKNFLECVGKGEITDCGKVQTVGEYLKKLHELGVNPVTISREQQSRMKAVKREIEPDIPQIAFRYPKYRYGIDFLPSPLWKLIFKKKVHDADRGNFGSSSTHIDFTELKNF